jgi:putative sigma-54 modulation protein|tara:strand:- start:1429 stop:1806 length:378 start_codon:yes stop_codon:yes gene_type:complete
MKDNRDDIILSGTHLELTDSLKHIVHEKMHKLFSHETEIVRLRIDLSDQNPKRSEAQFTAKGHIEIRGPALVATVTTEDLYKSIDVLENKLDRMLRRRSRLRVVKRKQTHAVEIPSNLPKVSASA